MMMDVVLMIRQDNKTQMRLGNSTRRTMIVTSGIIVRKKSVMSKMTSYA
jgi:hypothetical protein